MGRSVMDGTPCYEQLDFAHRKIAGLESRNDSLEIKYKDQMDIYAELSMKCKELEDELATWKRRYEETVDTSLASIREARAINQRLREALESARRDCTENAACFVKLDIDDILNKENLNG